MSDGERFLQHYMDVWPKLDDERLLEVMHEEASIHHSGMEAAIRGVDEPDYLRGIKALIPDLSLEVVNSAVGEGVVFIEYALSGTVAGRAVSWTGIGRFTLKGDRAIDAIGRWDNLDLLAQIDPDVRRTAFAEAAAGLVFSPDPEA